MCGNEGSVHMADMWVGETCRFPTQIQKKRWCIWNSAQLRNNGTAFESEQAEHLFIYIPVKL